MGLTKKLHLIGNIALDDAEINEITPDTGEDLTINLLDNAGARKLTIKDSDDAEVCKIDSNGLITSAAGLVGPVTGNVTGNVAGIETLTAKTATDLTIIADGDEDIKIKMGDASAVNKVIFQDSAAATVATLDSNGVFTAVTDLSPHDYATTDTSGAPTNAECVSAFGAAADVGAGFIGVYQDSHESGKSYICVSNGATYSVAELTGAA